MPNFSANLNFLLGYQGYTGLEYKPTGDTVASLGWIGEYGYEL